MLVQAPAASFRATCGAARAQSGLLHGCSCPPCLDAGQLVLGWPWRLRSHYMATEGGVARVTSLAAPGAETSRELPAMLAWLPVLAADVRGLWREIWHFAQRSMAACESGRTPWIQAALTGRSFLMNFLLLTSRPKANNSFWCCCFSLGRIKARAALRPWSQWEGLICSTLAAVAAVAAAQRPVAAPLAGGFWLTRVLATLCQGDQAASLKGSAISVIFVAFRANR